MGPKSARFAEFGRPLARLLGPVTYCAGRIAQSSPRPLRIFALFRFCVLLFAISLGSTGAALAGSVPEPAGRSDLLEHLRELSAAREAPRPEDVEAALGAQLVPADRSGPGGSDEGAHREGGANAARTRYLIVSSEALIAAPQSFALRVLPNGFPVHFLGGGAGRLAPYVEWLIVLELSATKARCFTPASLAASWGESPDARPLTLVYSGTLGDVQFVFARGCLKTVTLHLVGEERRERSVPAP